MKKKGVLLIALAGLFIILIGGTIFNFNKNLNNHIQKNTEARLQEIVEHNLVSFDLQVNEQIKKVKTFAEFLENNENISQKERVSLLRAAVKNNKLFRCTVVFPDGSFITDNNKSRGNVSEKPFFTANMKGNFYISDPHPATMGSEKSVMLFSCPIMKGDKVIGAVAFSYLCDDMNKLFDLDFMDGNGQVLVMKKDGQILISNSATDANFNNVISYIQENCTHEDHGPGQCVDFSDSTGACTVKLKEEQSLYLRYSKLDFNDWYLLSIVPESVTVETVSLVTSNQRNLVIVIASCAAIYFIIVALLWVAQQRDVDKMTGAFTLNSFRRQAKKILSKSLDENYVVVKLDVKDFKLINRIYSFEVGDRVIKNIAAALRTVLKNSNAIFARVEIDGFLVLLPYNGKEKLQAKRELFIQQFRQLMGENFHALVSFPTGQYILQTEDFPKPDIKEIIEKVNFAHRAAKQNHEIIIDYEEDIEKEALLEKAIEDRMKEALDKEEFTLYLQPKYNVADESLCGAEALVRWRVGEQFFMHPVDFIPTLEKNGFIIALDKYMFQCAVLKVKEFIDEGQTPIPISVNFSRLHLDNLCFVEELCEIADQYQVPRKYLEIELTESSIFGHVEQIKKLIKKLHAAGFSMSMDDFGSGYSSLAQLKELKVDILKIDKGFFEGSDKERLWIVVSNILHMAQELGITTVAEGIETKEQVEKLRMLNCDIIQGFYYSRPVPGKTLNL